jgi:hypothetical protein
MSPACPGISFMIGHAANIALLAKTDELHDYLSGPATKKIMEREWALYRHMEFRTISGISVVHLYNLRQSYLYRNLNVGDYRLRGKDMGVLPGACSGNHVGDISLCYPGLSF